MPINRQWTYLVAVLELPDYKVPEEPRGTVLLEGESTPIISRIVGSFDPAKTHHASSSSSVYQASCGTEVIYSYYPFISADAIHQILLEDLHYLERLGCYRLPSRPSLDEFVKAYFRYVHPHQPILDEGDFWRAYTRPLASSRKTFSIFVFQAMLFAACTFVPFSTIDRLGFSSFQTARATFYRRAKALFHIDSNRDTLSSAQGALLLTYYVSASDAKVNSHWLSNAICLAKLADAHQSEGLKTTSIERRTQLKRLWCCCLLRDRILALGLSRPMQIDGDEDVLFGVEDRLLHATTKDSMVYESSTISNLMKSFTSLCDLAASLRQTLKILPLHCTGPISAEVETTLSRVQACSEQLDHWFTEAKASCHMDGLADDAVTLHNNVIYVYYHSAKIGLWNHANYVSSTHGCAVHVKFSHGHREVEAAIHGIDANLQQIAEHNLLQFMPVTIVAYIAMPLVWHISNVKLNRQGHSASSRKRLSVYLTALNILKERYEGVDRVLSHIRQVVTYLDTRDDTLFSQSSHDRGLGESVPTSMDGANILTCMPQFFLRIMVIVQLALAQGQYPEENELPTSLGSPTGNPTHSMCTCVSDDWSLPDLGDAFEAITDSTPLGGTPRSDQAENMCFDGDAAEKTNALASTIEFDDFFNLSYDAHCRNTDSIG
ncbi:fungal-specific transcription factor domain-containing protein [Exophiala viscosa]|uniref:fungal-specific transcription factor domain-containing protein n=1 Tax=Exophiala viscosa TaxID=2486360 RepID=UPI00219D5266|nr:fungal-specific transcription factor domain-containing protein [Exophiala viscosa]